MSANSHSIDDATLLSALLGTAGDSVASPSSEMVEDLDNMRLYTALIALLVTAVMTLIVTWTRYHRDVSEALATADTQRPRMPLKPSGSKSSKKKQ